MGTHMRLKKDHAYAGRKMGGWDDVPEFVQAHAGPWKEGNYAATYKFREEVRPEKEGKLPFWTTVHKEADPLCSITNQWEEQDAQDQVELEAHEWVMMGGVELPSLMNA